MLAKLSCYAIDAVVLAQLQHPADVPRLPRAVRAGEHDRVHPGPAMITIGGGDELATV